MQEFPRLFFTSCHSSIFTPFWSESFCSKLGQHLWHIFFNFSTTHDQIVVRTYQCRWDDLRLQNPAWCLIGGPMGPRQQEEAQKVNGNHGNFEPKSAWFHDIPRQFSEVCNFSSIVSCLVSQEGLLLPWWIFHDFPFPQLLALRISWNAYRWFDS